MRRLLVQSSRRTRASRRAYIVALVLNADHRALLLESGSVKPSTEQGFKSLAHTAIILRGAREL